MIKHPNLLKSKLVLNLKRARVCKKCVYSRNKMSRLFNQELSKKLEKLLKTFN